MELTCFKKQFDDTVRRIATEKSYTYYTYLFCKSTLLYFQKNGLTRIRQPLVEPTLHVSRR